MKAIFSISALFPGSHCVQDKISDAEHLATKSGLRHRARSRFNQPLDSLGELTSIAQRFSLKPLHFSKQKQHDID
jgi:hypothetical protein